MQNQVFIGCLLMVLNTIIHAGGMSLSLRWLMVSYQRQVGLESVWVRSLVVGIFVLIMFVTTLIESTLWAVTYVLLGANAGFEEAFYFSTVTYTTLGYGDIVLESHWRVLSAFEAANGIIMFGWTTALIFVAIRAMSKRLRTLHDIMGLESD